MTRFLDVRQFHAIPPVLGVGGQADQVAVPPIGRTGPHAAAVAHNGDAQGAVGCLVRLHQLQHFCPNRVGIMRQFHMQRLGITLQPRPMPVPREGHSIGDTQGTENAPPGEQPYLSR